MRLVPPLSSALTIGLLVVLVLAVLLPASPYLQKYPSVDSGIFLYAGWRVTQGELPYRDVWDHKPPLIFAVDAVGLAFSGSRWGVWALEVVSLAIAAGLAFRLFQRAFGGLPAVYASVAWLVNAFLLMDGGNYTTEYSLPLQFGMLYVYATAPADALTLRRALVLGVLSGLLFWFKQSTTGIPLAIVVLLLLEGMQGGTIRSTVRALVGMGAGALGVSGLVLLPFAVQGALAQLWDATFLFNAVYVQDTWLDRMLVLRYVPVFISALGLLVFAVIGWLIAALTGANGSRDRRAWASRWTMALENLWGNRATANPNALTSVQTARLLGVALVAFPIELVLLSLPGNPFDHYHLTLLPVLGVLAAFTFRIVIATLERAGLAQWALRAFTALFIGVLLLFSAESVQPIWRRVLERTPPEIVNTLLQTTTADDTVYVWGGGGGLLFASRRAAPTRFVYLAPLLRRDYADESKAFELVQALLHESPRLILVSANASRPFLDFPISSPRVDAAAVQVRAAYMQMAQTDEWTIFQGRIP